MSFYIKNKSDVITKTYSDFLLLEKKIQQQQNNLKLLKAQKEDLNEEIKSLKEQRNIVSAELSAKKASESQEAISIKNYIMQEIERAKNLGSSCCTIEFGDYLKKRKRKLYLSDNFINNLFIGQLRTALKEFEEKHYQFYAKDDHIFEKYYLFVYW